MKPKRESGTLFEEMKQHLPIQTRLTKESQQLLGQKGMNIDPNLEINIIEVFDSGDMGGIVCAIEGDKKQALVISLTHLRIKPEHPLSDKIVTYQKQRIKRLRRYR